LCAQAVNKEKASLTLKRARGCEEAGVAVGATSRMRTEDPSDLLASIEYKLDEFCQCKDAMRTNVGPRTTITGIADGLLTEQER